ncbi:lachesin-like [Chelonus insularis]|uniref:lachesin-like n=1 Tax=Chelonus insularis TaxID=460826 RepID=UPI00158C2C61|nr:lachesin-like [Chelonus insularis]
MWLLLSIVAAFFSPIICDEKPMFYKNLTTSILANEGDSVQLECYASGSPVPNISWLRYVSYGDTTNKILPNGHTMFNGTVLEFPSITKDQRGRYLCIAMNGIGDSIQELFNLQVRSAPIITQMTRMDFGTNEIRLGCESKGNPPPGVTWYHNNEIINSNSDYKITVGGWSDWSDSADFFLSISKNNPNYRGTYKCLISNELGQVEHTFNISDAMKM